MALQDLIEKIKLSTHEEIEKLEKENSLEIKELVKNFEKEHKELTEENDKNLREKKDKLLEKIRKEKEHQFEMKILKEKNEMLEKAFDKIIKDTLSLEWDEKRKIIKKEAEKTKPFITKQTVIQVPSKEITEILKEVGISQSEIVEKELPFDDGFVIKDKGFNVTISLKEIVKEQLENSKEEFSRIIFSSKI